MSFENRIINGAVHVEAETEKQSDTLGEYRLERLLGPINPALPAASLSLPNLRIESAEDIRRDEQALQLLEDYQDYLRAIQHGEHPVDFHREDEFRRSDSGPEWEARIARARERRLFSSHASRDTALSSLDLSSSDNPVLTGTDSTGSLPDAPSPADPGLRGAQKPSQLVDKTVAREINAAGERRPQGEPRSVIQPAAAVERLAPRSVSPATHRLPSIELIDYSVPGISAPSPSSKDKGIEVPGTSKDIYDSGRPLKEPGSESDKRPEKEMPFYGLRA